MIKFIKKELEKILRKIEQQKCHHEKKSSKIVRGSTSKIVRGSKELDVFFITSCSNCGKIISKRWLFNFNPDEIRKLHRDGFLEKDEAEAVLLKRSYIHGM